MAATPALTEATIRGLASDDSFRRGREYVNRGAVVRLTRRGDQLHAEVEGSGYRPYQVRVTLRAGNVEEMNCTCPYEWGGACKHVVAALLVALTEPEAVEQHPPLDAILADLDRDQLLRVLLDLVRDRAELADVIESRALAGRTAAAPAAGAGPGATPAAGVAPRARATPLNPASFRSEVRAALRSIGRMRSSDAYWAVPNITGQIYQVAERARPFLDAGDGRNALVILEAVTDEYLGSYALLDDSDGEASGLFAEIDPLWAEALLTADLTAEERRTWAARLAAWAEEIADQGPDDAFWQAETAAVEGWDHPRVQRLLRGEAQADAEPGEPTVPPGFRVIYRADVQHDAEDEDDGAWDEDEEGEDEDDYGDEGYEEEEEEDEDGERSGYRADLIPIRLAILERQERTDEYLNLASATGRLGAYLTMLARTGRIADAVREGLARLTTPRDALALAQALHERGATDDALRIAEYGLGLSEPHPATDYAEWRRFAVEQGGMPYARRHDFGRWLRNTAAAFGRADLALRAAAVVVRERPSLDDYTAARSLAGDGWPALRKDLLRHLRGATQPDARARVDIFLSEHLIDDAVKVADAARYEHDVIEVVVDAAIRSHPEWVIRTCRAQADPIMDEGRAGQYEDAARWLTRARAAALASGREDEWRAYLDDVLARHGRKYKLVPLIKPLREG